MTAEGVATFEADGRTFLKVEPEALRKLAEEAVHDIQHYLRPAHLAQLRRIIDDPEASGNDKFVALDLLKNANIAAAGVLPMCQDTGTAIVMGKRGQNVLTEGGDEEALSRGIYDAYKNLNLRYSQMAPLTMWEEKNTGSNLPAQIELYATDGGAYKFLFMAKGGGSANKSFLYQETKAVLNESSMMKFLEEKIRSLGTAACPPYHLAIVVGGTSAEYALKTAKYASAHYLDEIPAEGSELGHGFRDKELEEKVFELTQKIGIGAQFGGKYFCHDVRVVRLPRHGASCPVAIAVSCSADRQAVAKITAEGVFLEQLETDPARFLPETTDEHLEEEGDVVKVDLNQPMDDILAELTRHPVKTRLSLTGPLVVARDIAHAKIKERLDAGEEMPQYLKDHPVYYAGPAKTPEGYASGSFGPTTAGRMDSYVEQFQAAGGSKVMLAKGNRSKQVTDACDAHGGFYLGSIGGRGAARTGLHQEGRGRRVRGARHGGGLEDRGRGLPRVHRGGRQGQRLLPGPGARADVHDDSGTGAGPGVTLTPGQQAGPAPSGPAFRFPRRPDIEQTVLLSDNLPSRASVPLTAPAPPVSLSPLRHVHAMRTCPAWPPLSHFWRTKVKRRFAVASLSLAVVLGLGTLPAVAAGTAPAAQSPDVDVTKVKAHLTELHSIAGRNGGTRRSTGQGYRDSVAYVKGKLQAAGYTVTEQPCTSGCSSGAGPNLIAEWPHGDANDVYMFGAHLDSVSAGPGMNDNGSGSAALLENALTLARQNPTMQGRVRFAWWTDEEQGLNGSDFYVRSLSSAQRSAITAYYNFDMIASTNGGYFVNHVTSAAAAPMKAYWDSLGLQPEENTEGAGRSDDYSFEQYGIPTSGYAMGASARKTSAQAAKWGGTAGTSYDPCYHRSCDNLDNINTTGLDRASDGIAYTIWQRAVGTGDDGGGDGCDTDPVVNGGFESGSSPWTGDTGTIGAHSGQSAHTGTRFAWLAGYGSTHTESVAQTVTVPTGCTRLAYWLHIDTDESGTTAYDTFKVKADGTTLATLSNADARDGYVQRTVDLGAYAGRQVALSFTGSEDGSLQTGFVLDDVSLLAG